MSRRPKVAVFARRVGSGNPSVKHIAMVDKQKPQKRPSRKSKQLRAVIDAATKARKAALAARAKQAHQESLIAAALHGPRARSRGKQRRARR